MNWTGNSEVLEKKWNSVNSIFMKDRSADLIKRDKAFKQNSSK